MLNQELNKKPFNAIVNIKVKRVYRPGIMGLGTASFIQNNILITANHVLIRSPFISRIILKMNKDSLYLRKKDFKILHYHKGIFHKKNKDIAILILKKRLKQNFLNHTNFELTNFDTVANKQIELHLTGYPCDRPDTLVDKCDGYENILTDPSKPIVSYKNIYTCTGDSGAPLWYEDGESFKLVSIHHGRGGNDNLMRDNNWGIKITQDVLNWIINIKKKYQ